MGRHAKHRGINHRERTPHRTLLFVYHVNCHRIFGDKPLNLICWTPFSDMILILNYKTLHLACRIRNEVIRLRSVDLGIMPNKIKHKSLEEWCQSTRRISCRNLRYSNPRCFGCAKNARLLEKVIYNIYTIKCMVYSGNFIFRLSI